MVLFGCIWSAIAQGAASLLSGLMSNKAARDMQSNAQSFQRSMQGWLMNNSGAMQARSAKQAGLSPAFALGGSSIPTASSPSGSAMPFNLDTGMDALQKLTQSKLQKQQREREKIATQTEEANRDYAREQAAQAAIETQRMRDHDKQFGTPIEENVLLDPNTDEEIENLEEWQKNNPNLEPKLIVKRSPSSYGAFRGQQEIQRWNQEIDDLFTTRKMNITRREQAMADKWYASLRGKVYKLQNASDLVIDCLANMEVAQYRNLLADLRSKRSAVALNGILGMLHMAEKGYVEANTENVKSETTNNYLRNYVDAYESQDKVWSTMSYTKEQANKEIEEGNYWEATKTIATNILLHGDKVINAAKDVQQMRKGKVPKTIAKPESSTIKSPWTSTTTY